MWLFAIFLTEFSPNPVSPQTEWVEVYNDSQQSLDLQNYTIRDATSSNKQILSGIISPQSYFVFNFDHAFLNNTSSDSIRLFDDHNNLLDSHASKPITAGLSFSREADGTWCPTDNSPNLPNNPCKNSYSLSNSPTPIPYISLEVIDVVADPDDGDESIVIHNPNNFSVSLFDWRVVDNSGSIRKLSCLSIEANGDCTAIFSSGYLNNDTDRLTLLDPLKREISIYSYNNSKEPSITKNPTSTKSPTKTPNTPVPKSPLSRGDVLVPTKTEGLERKETSVKLNQPSPIHNYLSIILMFIGSILILSPLIFHGKNNKKS